MQYMIAFVYDNGVDDGGRFDDANEAIAYMRSIAGQGQYPKGATDVAVYDRYAHKVLDSVHVA